jgi:hypothetical protein
MFFLPDVVGGPTHKCFFFPTMSAGQHIHVFAPRRRRRANTYMFLLHDVVGDLPRTPSAIYNQTIDDLKRRLTQISADYNYRIKNLRKSALICVSTPCR